MKQNKLTSNACFVRNYPEGEWHSPNGKYIDPLFAEKVESRTNMPINKLGSLAAVAETNITLTAFERAEQEAAKAEKLAKIKQENVTKFISQTQRVAKNIIKEKQSESKLKAKPKPIQYSPPKDLIKPKENKRPKSSSVERKKEEKPKVADENKQSETIKEKKESKPKIEKKSTKVKPKKENVPKPTEAKQKDDKPKKEEAHKKPYSPYKQKDVAKPLTPIQEILQSYVHCRESMAKY